MRTYGKKQENRNKRTEAFLSTSLQVAHRRGNPNVTLRSIVLTILVQQVLTLDTPQ